jgi:glycosyltransferase involved in cell wall biosynthesis
VGDGRERQALSALADSLSVGRYVIFSGYREDAMDIVSASDLYVSSSLIEGIPLNIIEALSLGKTVLATRIKGHTDLISDGDNGYLFDVGDEAGFIGSVCRILNGDRINPERAGESALGYGRGERSEEISRILLGVLE